MRSTFLIFTVLVLAFSMSGLSAVQAESTYYIVDSELSSLHAEETAEKLDAYFTLYNSYFHFNEKALPGKLNLKIFKDKEGYDQYLAQYISIPKDAFVLLQYSDPGKNELVGYLKQDGTFDVSLKHHAFLQFLKAFVKDPPLWMQMGFAIYFEKCVYNPEQRLAVYKENLSWVGTLKGLLTSAANTKFIPLDQLLNIDISTANTNIDAFYAETWGLVYFLLNTNSKLYNRLLWDAMRLIKPDADRVTNEEIIMQEAFTWISKTQFMTDFTAYVDSIKTFRDLVQEGMDFYANEDLDKAENAFAASITLEANNYIPYYYLGLIHYTRKNFSMAEYYYTESLEMGASEGLVNYVLGLNAYYAKNYDKANGYLQTAIETGDTGYVNKAMELKTKVDQIMGGGM